MISGIAYHPFETVMYRRHPFRTIPRKHTLVVGQPVTFNVRLRHNRKSETVADFIPKRMMGVMATAHGVEIGLFHHFGVSQHQDRKSVV